MSSMEDSEAWSDRALLAVLLRGSVELCSSQIEASTSPSGISQAFDAFSGPGGRTFDHH